MRTAPPENPALYRSPHKNSAIPPLVPASLSSSLPLESLDRRGSLDVSALTLPLFSPATSLKMSTKAASARTTVEQTPFVIPDLTIKDLLSAIP